MAEPEEDYSSSDDSDYVPEGASDSESEGKDDGENGESKGKQPKKVKPLKRKREGGIKLEGEEDASNEISEEEQNELENERNALEEERKKAEIAEREKNEKQKSDDLWSSFLSDVGPRPKGGTSKAADSKPKATEENKEPAKDQTKPGERGDAVTTATKEKTITVTKVYDFAGEEIKVTENVKASSQEAKNLTQKPEQTSTKPGLAQLPFGKRKPGGLGSVLGKMNKKSKMSVLDKSKMDWDSFKRTEGIEEDLRIHNKGKDGFLQRQDFLKETDLRQYEIERKIRMGQSGTR